MLTPRDLEANIDVVKTLTITSPISTDTFLTGYNTIAWTSTGDVGNINIKLYENGAYLKSIDYTANDGSYSWYIYENEYTDGSNYQIKISDSRDSSIYDYSDYFSIECETEKTITITAPTSTYTFLALKYSAISWSSTGDINYVKIQLYKNGVFLETISTYTTNDGSYSWYIYENEYTDGSNYQIRISDYNDDSVYDYSDYFSIECEIEDIPDIPDDNNLDNIISSILSFVIPITIIIGIILAIIIPVVVHNRKKRIPEEIIEPMEESMDRKIETPEITHCPTCGSKIKDKLIIYCSECGAPIK